MNFTQAIFVAFLVVASLGELEGGYYDEPERYICWTHGSAGQEMKFLESEHLCKGPGIYEGTLEATKKMNITPERRERSCRYNTAINPNTWEVDANSPGVKSCFDPVEAKWVNRDFSGLPLPHLNPPIIKNGASGKFVLPTTALFAFALALHTLRWLMTMIFG